MEFPSPPIFTARCYASAVLAVGLCPSVSVCLSQVGVLSKPAPILSVFPALIVHSELKSVYPGFPRNYENTMPETAFLGAQIAPKSLSAGASPQAPLGELTALPQTP